jgi:prepilin-type N-terminal cleavage/methylation domain-containing protein
MRFNIFANNRFLKKQLSFGYSLIEIMIVIGIFAVFSIIATESIILTLRSSKKSESTVNVKEELDYASTIIERSLQSAKTITTPSLPCSDSNLSEIQFKSRYNDIIGKFTCVNIGGTDPYIASSSGATDIYRMTSGKIDIRACSFSCLTESDKTTVEFNVTGSARGITGVEGSSYSTSRRIFLQQSERE